MPPNRESSSSDFERIRTVGINQVKFLGFKDEIQSLHSNERICYKIQLSQIWAPRLICGMRVDWLRVSRGSIVMCNWKGCVPGTQVMASLVFGFFQMFFAQRKVDLEKPIMGAVAYRGWGPSCQSLSNECFVYYSIGQPFQRLNHSFIVAMLKAPFDGAAAAAPESSAAGTASRPVKRRALW